MSNLVKRVESFISSSMSSGIGIPNSMGVQIVIVLARAKRTIFLRDKEKWCCLGRFGRDNVSCFDMFINEGMTCFTFFGI